MQKLTLGNSKHHLHPSYRVSYLGDKYSRIRHEVSIITKRNVLPLMLKLTPGKSTHYLHYLYYFSYLDNKCLMI